MALNYVTLTGNLGAGAIGAQAIFTPSGWLQDAADGLMFPPEPAATVLSATGTFSVSLLASDNTAPAPAGWSWSAEFAGVGQVATYTFSFKVYAGPVAFTATQASPAVFTATAPGAGAQPWAGGMAVTLSGASLPGGFSAATAYYLVGVSGSTFSLAATAGGSPIASTSAGSGSLTVTRVDISQAAPVQAVSPMAAYAQLGGDLSGVPAKVTGVQGLPVAVPGDTGTKFLRDDGTWQLPGSGSFVTSVTAGDASVTVAGTATAPTLETGRLDQIASLHPPTAPVPFSGQKATGLANGAAAGEAVTYGQLGAVTQSTQAGATYTLALTDAGTVARFTSASAVTVTVPANATIAFPAGTIINLYAAGAGGVSISPAAGVTVHGSSTALAQYQEVSLRYDGSDVWVRVG